MDATNDPSQLTIAQIEREVMHLRELLEARLDATDTDVSELEHSIARRLAALDELTDSRFVTHRTLLDSQADKVALALAAADKAVSKAETATEKRFESVNEFRQQLNDQTHTFISRAEYIAMRDALLDKVDELRRVQNLYQGKEQGVSASWAVLIGAVGLLAAVVALFAAFAR